MIEIRHVVEFGGGGAGAQATTPPVLEALQVIATASMQQKALLEGIAQKLDSIAQQAGQSSQGTAALLVEIRDRLPAQPAS